MYGESISPLAMLLPTAIYPLLAAVLVTFIIQQLEKRALTRLLFWGVPVLIWLSWIAGAQGIHTRWQLPPDRAMDWLLLASLLPALATRLPEQNRMSGFGVSCLLAFGLIAQPLVARMSGVDIFAQLIGWLLVCGIAISASDRQKNTFAFPVSLIVMITLSALVIGISSSLSLAQLSGALAAVLGGIWLVSRVITLTPQSLLTACQAVMAIWIMVMAYAHYYADVSIYALALLAAPLLWTWPASDHNPWWKTLAITIALSIIPGILSLWMIWPEQSLY